MAPDLHRSSEEDLARGRLDQRLTHGSAAVHSLDEPLWKPRALEGLLDSLAD
jgi:hypothetical protein